jgi:DNA-binding NarL/FixJ family response regulator
MARTSELTTPIQRRGLLASSRAASCWLGDVEEELRMETAMSTDSGRYTPEIETPAATRLRGRSAECRALGRLLDDARAGSSSTLVIRGDAGVGKTALLAYVAEQAADCRLARVDGVEAETGFAYAGLLQLLGGPLLARLEHLAGPQRDAVRRAFALLDGPPPEPFLVSLGALSLLSEVAEERPLVCLVDDAQWLDRESLAALSFVARRLAAEPIAMLFAVREPDTERVLDGLPELVLEGLDDADARRLLDEAIPGGLDEQVRERIVAETRGNPLALLELPRGLAPAQLAGGFGLPDARELSGRIEQTFLARVQALPDETQRVMLVAAAEAVGDAQVIARAAAQLGLDTAELRPAEDAGLIELGGRVRFRHPLVRSASYRGATATARRETHAALAIATDPVRDPDRRAWHRAHAAIGPDEDVAEDLARSAARAQARGGVAAAAEFLARAAELSPDPARRGARALAAARLKFDAAAPEAAERLLSLALSSPLEPIDRARLERLRAQIAFARTRGNDTPSLLSAAARGLEQLDPELARETHLEALWALIRSGRFARPEGVIEAAASAIPAGEKPTRAIDLMLKGVVARLTQGYEPALPAVGAALAAFRAEGFRRENLAWCWLACQLAMDLWADDACEAVASGLGRVARERGGLTILPFALNYSAAHQLFLGEFGVAEQLVREAEAITAATSGTPIADFSVLLAAWRGDRERTEAIRAALIEAGTARGEGFAVEVAEWAAAVLYNGLGEYAQAQAAAARAYDHDGLGFGVWVLPELIEAAAHTGDRRAAEAAFARLAERSGTSTREWARGVEAAAHALLREGAEAETLHQEAIDQLGRSRVIVLHARAQLNYGEWLRRESRRRDARTPLRAAHDAFEAMGARGFADRARRELLATGETVRKRTQDARDDLTPQEAQIARLAGDGRSNAEVAAELFLSVRTVEWHLRKVFSKLGIASRRELNRALPSRRPSFSVTA